MGELMAVAEPLQGAAVVAAAGAAAAALALEDPRRRALAMLVAPVLAALALASLVGDDGPSLPGAAPLAVAAGAGLAAVALLAWLFARRPLLLPLAAVAALPFRVPVSLGDTAANLLVPLYAVIAAGCLAHAVPRLRGSGAPGPTARDPRVRRLRRAFAVVLVLYALQALYSSDLRQAVGNVAFFYVPFALLFLLLVDVAWTPRVLKAALGASVVLAVAFAAIGIAEFATGSLVIANDKVVEANALQPYFRVNSLFFDPNIYGRYLALTMILLAALLLWTRRRREAGLIALALALLWAGLVFSLSQSSFAALLLGLAVLAALRWKPWPVAAVAGAAAAVGVGLVLLAPGAINVDTDSDAALDRATSGRFDLIGGGLSMVGDRPLWGFGSGAFAEEYREREDVSSEEVAAASHTIPLTVAAEQGVAGLIAYLFLVWSAVTVLLTGLRRRLARDAPWPGVAAVARAGLAAVYCALIVHTLVYAAYLEDPLAWLLLAVAAGLRQTHREPGDAGAVAAGRPDPVAAGA